MILVTTTTTALRRVTDGDEDDRVSRRADNGRVSRTGFVAAAAAAAAESVRTRLRASATAADEYSQRRKGDVCDDDDDELFSGRTRSRTRVDRPRLFTGRAHILYGIIVITVIIAVRAQCGRPTVRAAITRQ